MVEQWFVLKPRFSNYHF